MQVSLLEQGQGIVFWEEFLQLEEECFGIDAWNRVSVLSHLETNPSILLTSGNECTGYAFLYESPDEIEIFRIGVKNKNRRSGLGSKILDFITGTAKKPILLEVREDNTKAIQFYQKNLFRLVGHRKKYYTDGVNALLFRYGL